MLTVFSFFGKEYLVSIDISDFNISYQIKAVLSDFINLILQSLVVYEAGDNDLFVECCSYEHP